MRKYIVSDLHGAGEAYDSIMGYLENVLLTGEEVELFINGDLIDRGLDSFRMLIDVINRCNGSGKIKVHYLAGNHELLMYEAALERDINGKFPFVNDWSLNGGFVLDEDLKKLKKSEVDKIVEFIGNLDIYHKFDEIVGNKKLLLVHAQAPIDVYDNCHMHLRDNDESVYKALWTRKDNGFFSPKIGKDGFLTIIGHTPNREGNGLFYMPGESVINIDGGCSSFVCSDFDCDHIPVVEIKDGYLEVLIFNHNNEIINGFYFDGEFRKMSELDLNKRRIFIDHTYDNCREESKRKIKAYFG